MKKLMGIGVLLSIVTSFSAYAANPASKEYVDQTFAVIQQQIDALNSQS